MYNSCVYGVSCSNSAVNPLIYNAVSTKYRRAFRSVFCPCVTSCKFRRQQLVSSLSDHDHDPRACKNSAADYVSKYTEDTYMWRGWWRLACTDMYTTVVLNQEDLCWGYTNLHRRATGTWWLTRIFKLRRIRSANLVRGGIQTKPVQVILWLWTTRSRYLCSCSPRSTDLQMYTNILSLLINAIWHIEQVFTVLMKLVLCWN